MSEKITLWCNVKGDPALTKVKPGINDDISDLKELIQSKHENSVLRGIDAADLVLYKVRPPLDTRLSQTHLYRQPTTQIDRSSDSACTERVKTLNLSEEAIRLDSGYKVAAIFPQFVSEETLKSLKQRQRRPLIIPPKHDPEKLGEQNTLDEDHLHIIVLKPDTCESIACSMSSAN